jgi:hypothetical protein
MWSACKNKTMLREPVDSSTMRSVGYEPQGRTLEVEFAVGTVYEYLDVRASVHEELMAAESKGRYFNREVRDMYPYVRVSHSRASR